MKGAEVINSKGCSRLFAEIPTSTPSFRGGREFQSCAVESMSHVSIVSGAGELASKNKSRGPFAGLVICVTGLSKEARKQVMAATDRLGGEYSPHLHPQCTHLVVQSLRGRKFEHASKHGQKNGLFVVTLGWFVDSVRRNVRLSESLYSVKTCGEGGVAVDDLNRLVYSPGTEKSCLPFSSLECTDKYDITQGPKLHFPEGESKRRSMSLPLSGYSFYIDEDVSPELQAKVVEAAEPEGATFLDQWFVGCGASHVVCEGPSVRKYLGHSNNVVTPLWVLKTAREKRLQRLVHISADLARQTAITIDVIQTDTTKEEDGGAIHHHGSACSMLNASHEERQKIANEAKDRVRKRRNYRMQTCQTPIRPITPNSLLDSVCWSISEPTSSATIYTESSSVEDANGQDTSFFFDAKSDGKESEASFVNLSRPLTESEKSELIFKNHFLTILFPVDRFSEMGPCSRTFFSNKGFTCLQVLDYIYEFYQENLSAAEIDVAIHTDSRHADRLRSVFSSKETAEHGHLKFKRVDFLGSRKSFEMLKRVSGDNNSNVYELLIRA
ncbi:OLC1v1030289C1 [Oldenlandia corymbosa var. corymbosa]|uniref:OLC1v1030289C1 n=1 Tax=Oldenlandia corymbosa var. corymbosa TaxID=529605 RepID=A0AAV1CGH5_OLDCO|nr:OLC1v1030289C1 [Oldenlandia corymbosa var. corymbosa]